MLLLHYHALTAEPGVAPGSRAEEAPMLLLHHSALVAGAYQAVTEHR
jgi:hypothetical protein